MAAAEERLHQWRIPGWARSVRSRLRNILPGEWTGSIDWNDVLKATGMSKKDFDLDMMKLSL